MIFSVVFPATYFFMPHFPSPHPSFLICRMGIITLNRVVVRDKSIHVKSLEQCVACGKLLVSDIFITTRPSFLIKVDQIHRPHFFPPMKNRSKVDS